MVFNNIQTLQFKPQPTVYIFRCCQSSKQTTQETGVHFSQVKRPCLSVEIGRFQSTLFVSVFQGLSAVTIIVIDDSEKRNPWLDFELQSLYMLSKGTL